MISQDAITHIEGYRNRQIREAKGNEPYNLLKKGEIIALNAALHIVKSDDPLMIIEPLLDEILTTTEVPLGAYHRAGGRTAISFVKQVLNNIN